MRLYTSALSYIARYFLVSICAIHLCLPLFASEVLLLTPYKAEFLENHSLEGYLVSEKLDGVRAIWDTKHLKSRNANTFNPPSCWLEDFPDFILDGELWIERGRFEEISSIVSRANAECKDWQNVWYFVFDVPTCGDTNIKELASQNLDSKCTLLERLEVLQRYLDSKPNTHIKIIPQETIASESKLKSKLHEVIKNNGEGLVIRKNTAPYEIGRTKNALKYKPYEDAECKVIGYTQGKGRLEGKMGSIICEQQIADTQVIQFKIGSGFSDKERENPPALGSFITYKYFGYTKNNLPKFPVFLRIYNKDLL